MICKNCKKEIDNNAKFCVFCGSAAETYTKHLIAAESDIGNEKFKDKLLCFFAPLANGQILFIATLFLLLLNPVFAALKNVNISESLSGKNMASVSYSFFDFLTDIAKNIPFIYFLIVLGIASIFAAAFYMIFPLLKGKKYTAKYLILTKTISIIALVVMAFWFIIIFASYSYESLNSVTTLRITFEGCLFMLDSIALVITSFKLSSILKKNNKKEMNAV